MRIRDWSSDVCSSDLLGGVKQQLGDKWGQRSEQIIGLVEGIFRRRLDATDVFYKVDDENYLILFTRLGRQEAAFKAKVIADEIQKLVVGELPAGHEVIVSSTDRKSTRLNSSH